MRQNNVNISDTAIRLTDVNRNGLHPGMTNFKKPLVIGDVRFLIFLIKTFEKPTPLNGFPEISVTEEMTYSLSESSKKKLRTLLRDGRIKILEPNYKRYDLCLEMKRNQGLHFSDYLSILTAHEMQLQIITDTRCIAQEASRLKVQVVSGKKLMEQVKKNFGPDDLEKKQRVRNNSIFTQGVPAPIAGNN